MHTIHDHKYLVISVMGPHAGESECKIFRRKMADVKNIGKTFWVVKSFQAKPDTVQRLCNEAKEQGQNAYCVFIAPAKAGQANPTKTATAATHYSTDRLCWRELPKDLSPVTGKIDKGTCALVLTNLEMSKSDEPIDLREYADFRHQGQHIKIRQWGSTLCAVRKKIGNDHKKTKSHDRRVIAIAKLCKPFAVWLKS